MPPGWGIFAARWAEGRPACVLQTGDFYGHQTSAASVRNLRKIRFVKLCVLFTEAFLL
jgi:hypothetical protein